MNAHDLGGQFALDTQGIQRLQHTARRDPSAGLPEAARQFEALFLNMMLKSMREASPQSDLFSSQQSEFYNSLLDQQWSQHLAGRGFGLAEQLINQLEGRGLVPVQSVARTQADELIAGIPRGTPRVLSDAMHGSNALPPEQDFLGEIDARRPPSFMDELNVQLPGQAVAEPSAAPRTETVSRPTQTGEGSRAEHVQRFMDKLAQPAQAASRATGVPAELILAQAALETGWGRHEIPTSGGGNSYNLFGIKAGSRWQGATTDITTHEYINGQRTQMKDTFRAYRSYEEAFTDYARLIGDNPRYAGVVTAANAEQAAYALQSGGYATDPRYASKLIAVMNTMGAVEPLPERSLAGVFFSY
ncbi:MULTISPECIES: flagellar assembly peptidoglycan hydrolase FlgJ [Halomonadaceae]|uniref:flagellar assembly peptidoglycan hydrolase FlgJ n=1 Tax=Halomonadaceae TaxID=28256 RepID=UPI00159A3EA8|nr:MULTISPECIES: flagellar assembly peptidoglycan hydrolase FlgJ [Halomonas]QJQ94411.1 flagellar assembly peptidoglycan hydrolase FlgJ [Halomonas sp. PA5]